MYMYGASMLTVSSWYRQALPIKKYQIMSSMGHVFLHVYTCTCTWLKATLVSSNMTNVMDVM